MIGMKPEQTNTSTNQPLSRRHEAALEVVVAAAEAAAGVAIVLTRVSIIPMQRKQDTDCFTGAESGPINPYLPTAPSPPPQRRRRSSSLAYVDATIDGSAKDGYHETHARSSSRRRRRSEAEPEVSGEDAASLDDYDMYDRNGMRVRVREI